MCAVFAHHEGDQQLPPSFDEPDPCLCLWAVESVLILDLFRCTTRASDLYRRHSVAAVVSSSIPCVCIWKQIISAVSQVHTVETTECSHRQRAYLS